MKHAAAAASAAADSRVAPLAAELFSSLAAISTDAIVSVDDSLSIVFFNEGAERIFGWSAAEALGRPLAMLLPERFRAAHAGHVQGFGRAHDRARRMGERQEISGLRKDATEFPAEASITRVRVPDGTTIYTAVLRDITDRKRAEERQRFLAEAGESLAGSLAVNETLDRVAAVALSALGELCVVTLREESGERRMAVAHVDPLVRRAVRQLRRDHPPGETDGPRSIAQVMRTGRPLVLADDPAAAGDPLGPADAVRAALPPDTLPRSTMVIPLVARDRVAGTLLVACARRRYGPEDLALAEDLARRAALALDNARLHERLSAESAARAEMLAIVSHDLRNPVSAVKMLAGSIVAGGDPAIPADVLERVRVMGHAAEQMDRLIQDLLDLTRIEAGRLRVQPRPVVVSPLLHTALDTLAPLAAERAVSLETAIPEVLPDVLADPERVEQLLSNLVGNALKFTPPGGRIRVSAEQEGDAVRIAVTDSGPGIPEEQIPHVFDRFWQGRQGARTGAGLGLPISRGIVEAHGGRIRIESRPGAGTTVSFTLPTMEA